MLHVLHSNVLSCPNILAITNKRIFDLSLLLIVLQLTEHVLYAYKTYLAAFRQFSTHNKHILRTQANKLYSSVRPGKTHILEEVIKQ